MTETGTEHVTYDVRDGVAWARIDHGKANALSFDVLAGLDRCLTAAEGAEPDLRPAPRPVATPVSMATVAGLAQEPPDQ